MNQTNAFSTHRPLTREEVAARVIPILAEEAGMDPGDLRETHSLANDLMYDSLAQIETAKELEEEFDVNVPDEAAEGMKTVGDVVDGICRLLKEQAE